MKNKHKTKAQLVQELADLRQRIAELEAREADRLVTRKLSKWMAHESRMKDSAIESSIHAIAFADLDGNLVYVNESFLRMWRYEKEEDILGEPATSFWQAPAEASEVLEKLRNRGGWTGEMVALRKDSSLFTVQVSANMVIDEKGVPICMMGAFADITERKKMEEEIKKHREHLEELVRERTRELEQEITQRKNVEKALLESIETTRALLNAPTESAILLDLEGTILDLNTVAADRLGKSVEDLVGISVNDILPPNVVVSRKTRADEVVRSRKPVRYTDERAGMIFDQTAFPVFNAQGKVERLAIFAHDITERKRAEKALQESEELFRTIVEVAPSLLVITDGHGCNHYVSPNCEEFTGYTQEELVGTLKWWVHEEDIQRAREVFDRAIREGEGGRNFEYKAIRKNGDIWFASSSWEPLRDDEGKFKGAVVQTIDITEHKMAELEIETSRQKYMDLFELAPDSIITTDLNGVITSCNAAVGRISGYSREELIGRHFSETSIVKAEDIPKYQKIFDALLNGELPQHVEVDLIRKDGTQCFAEVHFGVLRENGKITGIQVITRDITTRKKAEAELRESEKKFREFADMLPQIVCETDAQGNITFVNSNALKILGYTRSEFEQGLNVLQMLVPDDRERARENIRRVLSEGTLTGTEYTARRKDGSTYPIIVHSNPIIVDKRPVGLRAVIVDISEQKRMEEALRLSKLEWEATFDAMSDWVALIDLKFRILRSNRAGEEFTGVRPSDMVGRTCCTLVHGSDAPLDRCPFRKMLCTRQRETLEFQIPDSDRRVTVTVDPVLDGDGNLVSAVHTVRDIGECI